MHQAPNKRDHDPRWLVRSPRRLQMAVFILVGAVSLLGVFGIENAEMRRRHAALERNAADIAAGLRQLATEHQIYLRASAALVAAHDPVTTQDFGQLQSELNFDHYRQGSMGVGWAPRVPARDVKRTEAALQAQTSPAFHIHSFRASAMSAQTSAPAPDDRQRDIFPVVFLNPPDADNAAAVGFDMYSEAQRRAAMDRAAAIDGPEATGKLQLDQDAGRPSRAGFVIFMPVFRHAAPGRRRTLRGFVFMPFRASALLAMAGALSGGELSGGAKISVAAYDGTIAPDRLMATLGNPADAPPGNPADAARKRDNSDELAEQVIIANRPWQLVVVADRLDGLSRLSQITILSGLAVAVLLGALIRMTYQKINEERQLLEWRASEAGIRNSLTRELNHRVKNTLATVLSIVTLTRRRETDLDHYVESLSGRIRALSATHDLLTSSDWASIELRHIILAELAPYLGAPDLGANEEYVSLDGPEIRLAPNDALTLGLAVHELATNAAKYGALSVLTGRIDIHWQKLSEAVVEIHWRETGGPAVAEPSKRGFGRELIEKILARELDSPVSLNFAPDGLQCVFRVPLRQPAPFVLRTGPQPPPGVS